MSDIATNRPAGLDLQDLYRPGQSARLRAEFARITPPTRIRALATACRTVPAEAREWARDQAMTALAAGAGKEAAFLPYRLLTERDSNLWERARERIAALTLSKSDVADGFLALADAVLALAAGPALSERQLDLLLAPLAQSYPGVRSMAKTPSAKAA